MGHLAWRDRWTWARAGGSSLRWRGGWGRPDAFLDGPGGCPVRWPVIDAVGTVNPVREIADAAHKAGAPVFVDAVHAVPHLSVDVADFLACSPDKFFGQHLGVLWRRGLLEQLPAYKVRPAPDSGPAGE